MMQIPYFRNINTVKCDRCELRYPKREGNCPHCSELSENEVYELKARIEQEASGTRNLGLTMLLIAGIALVVLFVVASSE